MTYLSGKQQKRKQTRRYFFLGVFLLGILFFWGIVKGAMYSSVEPFIEKYGVTKSTLSSIPNFFSTYTTSRTSLTQKNKTLEVTIENLENQIAEKDAKLKELGFVAAEQPGASMGSIIVMYPIMKDITKIYSTILLSKGYKDGVEKDSYVFVRGLQPVCIIREVYTSTSLCELISKGGITTEAVVMSPESTSTALTLTGRGGGSFLGNVPRDTPIAVGDTVFLKSDQSMSLGKVVDVINNNQDTSWRVFVRGSYNPVTSSVFYIYKK
jgi:cell shape-determining protein MreC